MNYMLKLYIHRFSKGLRYTVGILSYVGYDEAKNIIETNPLFCNTMEDVVRLLRSSADMKTGMIRKAQNDIYNTGSQKRNRTVT